MPAFRKDSYRTPFGVNVYLRSTQDIKTESYTCSAASVPAATIDTWPGQKVLQKGVVMAKITSTGESGKIGPYQPGTGSEVQTITVTGTPTGGSFELEFQGQVTGAIAWNATAADVKAALEALPNVDAGAITATGGAFPGTPVVVTFGGNWAGRNAPRLLLAANVLTGGSTPTASVAETTAPGAVAGATDGRGDPDNIVGFCNTFLPWQLTERDVEVAVVYEASVVQANCLVMNPDGTYRVLDDSTAAAMQLTKRCNFVYH